MSASTNINVGSDDYTILINGNSPGSNVTATINLPDPSTTTNHIFVITALNSQDRIGLTISPAAGSLIGRSSYTSSSTLQVTRGNYKYITMTIQSDGSNYYIISQYGNDNTSASNGILATF
jgi:hypothetical protein